VEKLKDILVRMTQWLHRPAVLLLKLLGKINSLLMIGFGFINHCPDLFLVK